MKYIFHITTSRNALSERLKSESGALYVFFLIALPVLLMLLSLAFTVLLRNIRHQELVMVADAAALAGTASLCHHDTQCWKTAREMAIDAVNAHSFISNFGTQKKLELDPDISGTVWKEADAQNTGLEVSVERGRVDGSRAFLPLEDIALIPQGVPTLLAANAVRVSISAPIDPILFYTGLSFAPATIAVTSVATVGDATGTVPAAPFAIPVCALARLDTRNPLPEGEPQLIFQRGSDCFHEFLFTGVARHGNFHPEFLYQSCKGAAGDPACLSAEVQCHWNNQKSSENFRDYGVAGLPYPADGMKPSVTEESVQGAIQTWPSETSASLGDYFAVLGSGLASPDSEEIVWNQIVNLINGEGVADTENHPAFFTLMNQPFKKWMLWQDAGPTYFCNPPLAGGGGGARGGGGGAIPTVTDGLCRSRRMRVMDRASTKCTVNYASGYDGSTPVWHLDIPIIADVTETPGRTAADVACSGMQDVNPSHEHIILGFLKAGIYDADIGNGSVPSWRPTQCWAVNGSCAPGYPCNPSDSAPWEFTAVDCNLVRGKLDCDKKFLACTDAGGLSEATGLPQIPAPRLLPGEI